MVMDADTESSKIKSIACMCVGASLSRIATSQRPDPAILFPYHRTHTRPREKKREESFLFELTTYGHAMRHGDHDWLAAGTQLCLSFAPGQACKVIESWWANHRCHKVIQNCADRKKKLD
jgi:hypothetical protein